MKTTTCKISAPKVGRKLADVVHQLPENEVDWTAVCGGLIGRRDDLALKGYVIALQGVGRRALEAGKTEQEVRDLALAYLFEGREASRGPRQPKAVNVPSKKDLPKTQAEMAAWLESQGLRPVLAS